MAKEEVSIHPNCSKNHTQRRKQHCRPMHNRWWPCYRRTKKLQSAESKGSIDAGADVVACVDPFLVRVRVIDVDADADADVVACVDVDV